jgi:hypothetical protein
VRGSNALISRLSLVLVIAAGALVTFASPAAAAARLRPTAKHPCATTGAPLLRDFTIDRLPGLSPVVDGYACSGYRGHLLWLPAQPPKSFSMTLTGDVTLMSPGVMKAAWLRGATRVSGHGITGYSVMLRGSLSDSPLGCALSLTSSRCARVHYLFWRYTSKAWGLVADSPALPGDPPSYFATHTVDRQLAVAAAVHPWGRMRVPFRLTYVPAGLHVLRASAQARRTGPKDFAYRGIVSLGRRQASCWKHAICREALMITVTEGRLYPLDTSAPGRNLRINGHPAHLNGSLEMQTPRWHVVIRGWDEHFTAKQLIAIAKYMRFAHSVVDRTRWFQAQYAAPR